MNAQAEATRARRPVGRSGFERLTRAPYVVLSAAAAGLLAILLVLVAALQRDPLVVDQFFLLYLLSLPILAALGLLAHSRSGDGAVHGWRGSVVQWAASSACAVLIALLIYGLGWNLVLRHLQRVKTELSEYNYPHFDYALYEYQPHRLKMHAGMHALDETLYDLNGNEVHLSTLWAKRPIVIEFGSIT